MFQLFNRVKSSINSISVPDIGWTNDRDDDKVKHWINPEQTLALSVNFFGVKPDLPTMKNVDVLRSFYRDRISKSEGGMIETTIVNIKGFDAVRAIFKFPQENNGTTYLASLTIPFKNCSYVVKIQAPEIGFTGVRETVIADKLMKAKKLAVTNDGQRDWFADPYDSTYSEGTLMNGAEKETYDEEFPDHPLTQARNLLKLLESEIEFDETLREIRRFEK